MSNHKDSTGLEADIAAFDEVCSHAAQAIASSRSVRETMEAADVDVPHQLQAVVRVKVPSYSRLRRQRDMRVEEVVKGQLESFQREHSDFAAQREFDRIKAVDWYVLRAEFPELYTKALKEAALIIMRKQKKR